VACAACQKERIKNVCGNIIILSSNNTVNFDHKIRIFKTVQTFLYFQSLTLQARYIYIYIYFACLRKIPARAYITHLIRTNDLYMCVPRVHIIITRPIRSWTLHGFIVVTVVITFKTPLRSLIYCNVSIVIVPIYNDDLCWIIFAVVGFSAIDLS